MLFVGASSIVSAKSNSAEKHEKSSVRKESEKREKENKEKKEKKEKEEHKKKSDHCYRGKGEGHHYGLKDCPVVPPPPPTPVLPILAFTTNATNTTVGASTTLSWSTTNATTCVASRAWSGTKGISGTESLTSLVATTSLYELTCVGNGGTTTKSVSVMYTQVVPPPPPPPVPPTLTLTTSTTSTNVGASTTLSWSSSNATSCMASNAWIGAKSLSASEQVTSQTATTSLYTLTCAGVGGTTTQSVSVLYASSSNNGGGLGTTTPGSLTLSKYAPFANQTYVVPQTAVKIGEYRLQAGSVEDINLNKIELSFTGTAAQAHITDLYVTYGANTTSVFPVSSLVQNWTINTLLAKNSTMDIKVYATLSSAIGAGSTIITTLAVEGVGASSTAGLATIPTQGQIITAGNGVLTTSLDPSTPLTSIVVAGSQPKVSSFKFTAVNDSFTVTELYASTSPNAGPVIGSLIWKDGATTLATVPFNGSYATATGLSIVIPANTTKVIDAYLQLGSVNTPGAAASGMNARIGLDGHKYRNSNNIETTVATQQTDLIGNSVYVYKTKPTISNVALPSTTLTAGTQTVAKFNISADSAGAIAWRKLVLTVSSSSPVVFTVGNYNIYDSANESVPLPNVTVLNGGTSTITFISSLDQEVAGSKTYVIKAVVAGAGIVPGAFLSHNIAYGQASFAAPRDYFNVPGASTFVWSDESEVPHSASSATWNGDYFIKNIPTDSQTLTK